jgi:hypothetical protein
MPNLDVHRAITQSTQLLEKTLKFLLQREVGAAVVGQPRRLGVQLDRLHDARGWFKARRPAADYEALDYAKHQAFDDLHSPVLIGI